MAGHTRIRTPTPLTASTTPPFDPDYDNNRDWSLFPSSTFRRVSKGIQAHSAALGLTFLQNTNAPAAWKNGALIALHGSWNRVEPTGYKVVYFPWHTESKSPLSQADLVTGWFDTSTQNAWGRPVDSAVGPDGAIYISADRSGAIYRLAYTPPTDTGNLQGLVDPTNLDEDFNRYRPTDWRTWSNSQRKPGASTNGISHYGVIGETIVTSDTGTRAVKYSSGQTKIRLHADGVSNGFTFTIPADSTMRALKVALGTKNCVGRLAIKLSDSATEKIVSSKGLPNSYEGTATIKYRASGPGQRLTVNWTVASGSGSVFIQGASLSTPLR